MSIVTIDFNGEKKFFKYDRENAIVLNVIKATAEDIANNEEWMEKYGKQSTWWLIVLA